MKIFDVGYKFSNYYLIDAGQNCLAIDVGWPGTINDYGRQLRPTGKRVQDINYLIVPTSMSIMQAWFRNSKIKVLSLFYLMCKSNI